MSDSRRVRDLTHRYFDGLLAAAEVEELQRLLRDSPEAADEFARLARAEGDLAELFAGEQDIRRESRLFDALRRRERRRVWLRRAAGALVAACVLAVVGGTLLLRLTRPDEVRTVHTPGHEVVAGAVEQAAGVARVTSAEAVLRLADGSRVRLERDSEFVPPTPERGRWVELRRGKGLFLVSEAEQPFEVETPAGRVTALGTEFSVTLTPEMEARSMRLSHYVMTVAVLTGVVQVETGGVSHLLSIGQSRAFGQEERPGQRPATRAQKATVESVGQGKLTLAGGERREATTLDIAETTKVFVDGKPAKLSDLSKGMLVSIERPRDGDAVVSVRAEGPTIGAFVESVSQDKVKVKTRGEGRKNDEVEYALAKGAKITVDGKPGAVTDLKAGDRVGLGLSADRKTVMAIVKGTGDREGGRPRDGLRDGQRTGGAVAAVDAQKNTLSIRTEAGDREYGVAKDAKVTIDGKDAKLADVKTGTRVMLLLDRDGKTATTVTVGRGREGAREREGRVQGRVKSADKTAGTLTLHSARERGEDRVVTLAKDAKVTIDGKAAKLEDLKEGMIATLTLSEDKKTVSEIAVAPARRREREEKKEKED